MFLKSITNAFLNTIITITPLTYVLSFFTPFCLFNLTSQLSKETKLFCLKQQFSFDITYVLLTFYFQYITSVSSTVINNKLSPIQRRFSFQNTVTFKFYQDILQYLQWKNFTICYIKQDLHIILLTLLKYLNIFQSIKKIFKKFKS